MGNKLFKRLAAFVTAVAVLASMGTVAFATTTGAVVTIENATYEAITENDQSLYEVTVDYQVTGDIGSKGITMLAYAKANEDAEDLAAGENFTQFNSTDYKVAYVTQKAPELNNGEGSIVFKVNKTTGNHAVDFKSGDKMLILLGGDNVAAPASALLEKINVWTAESVAYAGTIPNVEDAKPENHNFAEYAKGQLNGQVVTLSDGGENSYDLTLNSNNYTVATSNGTVADGKATITATVTLNAGTVAADPETITIPEGITFTTTFESEIQWTATTAVLKAANGDEFGGIEDTLEVSLDEAVEAEAIKAAFMAELDGCYVTFTDGSSSKDVDLDDIDVNIEETEEVGATHKAILTAKDSAATDGVTIPDTVAYEVLFSAETSWTADALAISKTEGYIVYGEDIETEANAETIAEAIKAQVIEQTITAKRNGRADLSVELNGEDKDNITVTAQTEITGESDATNVTVVVALAEGVAVGNATVGEGGVETEITVSYKVNRPTSWTVANAVYTDAAIPNIAEAREADDNFAAYAREQLNGKKVTLSDGEGNSYDLTLDDTNCGVEASRGEIVDGRATITVTITIMPDEVTDGTTPITIPDDITATTTFESVIRKYWTAESVAYAGTIPNITDAVEEDHNFADYAKGQLNGKKVTLSDGEDNSYELTLDDTTNYTVVISTGEIVDGKATITATVTLNQNAGIVDTAQTIEIPEGITFTATFESEINTHWTVASVAYAGTIPNVEEAKSADFDFADYAKGQLNGKVVTLSGGADKSYDLTLDATNYTVVTSNGAVVDGKATITATVTIRSGEVVKSEVNEYIDIPEGITFTTTFESAIQMWAYGDVNHSGEVDVFDVTAVARYVVGLDNVGTFDVSLANANDLNGAEIDVFDVTAIARYVVGLDEVIPYSKRP